jgi:hypothetical protein
VGGRKRAKGSSSTPCARWLTRPRSRRGAAPPFRPCRRERGPMRRRPFLDQRRPSFKRRWQQQPWWVRILLSLLLVVLLGSPDLEELTAFHLCRVLRMVAEYRQPLVKIEGASLNIAQVAAVATGASEARVELDESVRSRVKASSDWVMNNMMNGADSYDVTTASAPRRTGGPRRAALSRGSSSGSSTPAPSAPALTATSSRPRRRA